MLFSDEDLSFLLEALNYAEMSYDERTSKSYAGLTPAEAHLLKKEKKQKFARIKDIIRQMKQGHGTAR